MLSTSPRRVAVVVHPTRPVDEATQATFYRYRLINRNAQALETAYVGLYSDVDLGDGSDDWVGTDTLLGMGYIYNGDNADGSGTGGSYGTPP